MLWFVLKIRNAYTVQNWSHLERISYFCLPNKSFWTLCLCCLPSDESACFYFLTLMLSWSDLELIGKVHLSCLCKALKRVIDSLGYLRPSVWTNNVVNKCFGVKKSWIIYVRVTSEWFTRHCDFIFLMFIFISFKDLH